MGKQQSVLTWRQIERPKHVEEISGEESSIFYPWEIMLMIKPYEFDDFTYPQFMYLRGADRQQVAMMAHNIWVQWYKTEKGLVFHRYPDVEEIGSGRGISEQEYQEKLEEASRQPSFRYLGMRANPSVFTFIKDQAIRRKLIYTHK